MPILQVCVPNTLHDYFDYESETMIPIGTSVLVPFGQKERFGVVVSHKPASIAKEKLKPIARIVEHNPCLSPDILHLFQFVSQYYQAPLSQVLNVGLPKRFREGKGLARKKNRPIIVPMQVPPIQLNTEQNEAVQTMLAHGEQFQVFMLEGVTGSGKTEVYLEMIEKCLTQDFQALVLVPEIGLTKHLIERFQSRLSVPVVTLHSNLSEGERLEAWLKAESGEAKVVIGTRTAIFTPFAQLGLIIIDEEHDASYKQQDRVRYSARDTAIVRAKQANIPIILGSATPSLETLENCQRQKYRHLFLKHRAKAKAPLDIKLVDLRSQRLIEGLAQTTLTAIEHHLQQNQQVLVFINRRGFAPVLLCHHCGWTADCPKCDTHLVLHLKKQILQCHHCGNIKPVPKACPECQNQEMIPIGLGTQRIENFLKERFVDTTILRIDRDEIGKKTALNEKLQQIQNQEAQLIIGTQILAKGHDFKHLTLVVILDCDQGLTSIDFRATERLGQLLTQVAGRAGRAEFQGQVLIQTHFPNHPLLQILLKDGYSGLSQTLLEQRKIAQLPPFAHMSLIRAEAKNSTRVNQFLMHIKALLPIEKLQVYGPAPATLAKKAGVFREQLLIFSPHRKLLNDALTHLRHFCLNHPMAKNIRWSIDIDPVDLGS